MIRRPLPNALRASPFPVPQIPSSFPVFALRLRAKRSLTTETEAKPRPSNSKIILGPASTPQLDHVFTKMLHKVILPARLPKHKRKLIASERNRQRLTVDPVIIEIDGYEHQFEPLDFKMGHVPPARPLLHQAIKMMKTREDWQNLVRILAGYKHAKIGLKSVDYQRIVNSAGKTRNMFAIVDALRRTAESGLRVASLPMADHILHWLTVMAVSSGFAERETRKAATWSYLVYELMTDPEHKKLGFPLHREPQVVGQLLHLFAARSVFHLNCKDEDGRVAEFATVLAVVWPTLGIMPENRAKGLLDLHQLRKVPRNMEESIELNGSDDAAIHLSPSRHIAVASYMLHGIKLAKQVVQPELASRLEPIEEGLRVELARRLKDREGEGEILDKGKKKRCVMGWEAYDTLIASEKPVNWGVADDGSVEEEVFGDINEESEVGPARAAKVAEGARTAESAESADSAERAERAESAEGAQGAEEAKKE